MWKDINGVITKNERLTIEFVRACRDKAVAIGKVVEKLLQWSKRFSIAF